MEAGSAEISSLILADEQFKSAKSTAICPTPLSAWHCSSTLHDIVVKAVRAIRGPCNGENNKSA